MDSKNEQSIYKTLGVSSNATEEQIKAAYREKALKVHPDKAGWIFQQHPEKYTNLVELEQHLVVEFQKLNEAYEILLERLKNSQEINSRASFTVTRSNRKKITNQKLAQLIDFLNTLSSKKISTNSLFTYIDPTLLKAAITNIDDLADLAFEAKLNSEQFANLIACLTEDYIRILIENFWKHFDTLQDYFRNNRFPEEEKKEQLSNTYHAMKIFAYYIHLLKKSDNPVPLFFHVWLVNTLFYDKSLLGECNIESSVLSAIMSLLDNYKTNEEFSMPIALSIPSIICEYEEKYGLNLLSTLEDNHIIKILLYGSCSYHFILLNMLSNEHLTVILQKLSASDFSRWMNYAFHLYNKVPSRIRKVFFVEFFDKINPFDFRNYFNDRWMGKDRRALLNSVILQHAFLAQNKDPLLALYYSSCQPTVRDYCNDNGKQDELNNYLNTYKSDLKNQIIIDLGQLSFHHRGKGVEKIVLMAQEGRSWDDIVNECKARKDSFIGWLHTIPFLRLFSPRTPADHLLYSVISDFDNNVDNYTKASNLTELLHAHQKYDVLKNLKSLRKDRKENDSIKHIYIKSLASHVEKSSPGQSAYDTVKGYLDERKPSFSKDDTETNRDSLFEVRFFRESTTKIKINELLEKVKSEMILSL